MRNDRLERLLFRVMPLAVLLAAFAGICAVAGSAWPWNRVVHEDGVRTLLGTLFFFEHATRELVPDLLLALGVAGSVRWFFPPSRAVDPAAAAGSRRRLLAMAAVVLLIILGGTIAQDGASAILDNLSQLHTRAGAPLVWGAHWRYHLLERIAQILLAFCVTGLLWVNAGRPDARATPDRKGLFAATLVLFAVLTLLFRPTLEPFREPTFLGHQARELFTHTLVTLPLALGVCLGLARRFAAPAGARSPEGVAPVALAGLLSVAAGAYLLVGSLLTGAQSQGQTSGLAGLIFPHFAEHFLGYLLVPALAGALYLRPGPFRRRPPASPDSAAAP